MAQQHTAGAPSGAIEAGNIPTDPGIIKWYLSKFGSRTIEYLTADIKKRLQEEISTPIRIAVAGQSGCGKSAFINTVRGLTAEDPGAAAVGVTECTSEVTEYPDPDHPNLVWCDLPGVGTASFPKETYKEKVKFESYDAFIIMISVRVMINDIELAQFASKMGKCFFFVRSKIDDSIRSDKLNHPRNHNETQVLLNIRADCKKKLCDHNLEADGVYLISSLPVSNRYIWDFPKLLDDIVANQQGMKKKSAIYGMKLSSEKGIREKTELLKSQVSMYALLSAAGNLIPIAGIAVDVGILVSCLNRYKKVYGIRETDVSADFNELGLSLNNLSSVARAFIAGAAKTLVTEIIEEGLSTLGKAATTALAVTTAITVVGLVVLSVAGSALAYKMTEMTLNKMIDSCEKTALEILHLKLKALRNRTD